MPTIGSQALLRVLPRTPYDFRALKDGTITIPIAQHIDVLGYERATLQVRVHSGTLPKGASLQLQLADDGFSAEDPASAFLQTRTAAGDEIGALAIGDGAGFPFYQTVSTAITGKLGRLLAIVVSFTGGSAGGPAVVLSMDLVLTGGTVGSTIHQPQTYLGYAHEPVERAEMFEPLGAAPAPAALRDEALVARLSNAVRDALLRDVRADVDGGYPRFGNVNVGINDRFRDIDGGYPRFGNVNVARDPGRVFEGGGEYPRFGNVNVARDPGGVFTGGGEYPRFGNVNVGRGELEVPRGEVEVPRVELDVTKK